MEHSNNTECRDDTALVNWNTLRRLGVRQLLVSNGKDEDKKVTVMSRLKETSKLSVSWGEEVIFRLPDVFMDLGQLICIFHQGLLERGYDKIDLTAMLTAVFKEVNIFRTRKMSSRPAVILKLPGH
jgi:hypothetical protein